MAGPNWLLVGEAAAMVDPMTSNGVTAALRHASEAASLLIRYRDRERLPWLATTMYSKRVEGVAKFFNCGIEKVVYDWPVRSCMGALTAGDVYTVPAWSMNTVYARMRPRGCVRNASVQLPAQSLQGCGVSSVRYLQRGRRTLRGAGMMPMLNLRGKSDGMYLLSQGSGDAVLFLHGIPTSCHLWDGVIERMSGTYTCMAVDLPGLGRTPKAREGFGELNAIVAKLEALRIENNVERWHVVGHDAGCAIAVHYAHQHPAHTGRLALLTPSIFPDLEPFFLFELLRKPVLGELMAPLVNLIFWKLIMRRTMDGSQAGRDVLADFRAPFSGPLGAWRLMSLLRWGRPEEVLAAIPALLPELLMPTLIFHGAHDPAVPASFAARASGLIPDSEMVISDSGHFLPMNEPAAIAEKLLSFLNKNTVEPRWLAADSCGVPVS